MAFKTWIFLLFPECFRKGFLFMNRGAVFGACCVCRSQALDSGRKRPLRAQNFMRAQSEFWRSRDTFHMAGTAFCWCAVFDVCFVWQVQWTDDLGLQSYSFRSMRSISGTFLDGLVTKSWWNSTKYTKLRQHKTLVQCRLNRHEAPLTLGLRKHKKHICAKAFAGFRQSYPQAQIL